MQGVRAIYIIALLRSTTELDANRCSARDNQSRICTLEERNGHYLPYPSCREHETRRRSSARLRTTHCFRCDAKSKTVSVACNVPETNPFGIVAIHLLPLQQVFNASHVRQWALVRTAGGHSTPESRAEKGGRGRHPELSGQGA